MVNILLFVLLVISLSAFAKTAPADSIPYPFHEVQENKGNKVMVVDNGVAALELRVQMIRRAQKNIEVEYFIYNTDMAGKIITRELVAAANRGVKVRVLIDMNMATFQFNSYYAQELIEKGIQVKYYNSAPIAALSTVQFRNHRKLISVDDIEAITGGRNIGEDYFDMSHEFNFNDRDIYLTGPMVKVMRDSFDLFFDHEMSVLPDRPEMNKNNEHSAGRWQAKVSKAKAFLEESPEETLIRSKLATLGQDTLATYKLHDCPTATFATDSPGGNFRNRLKEKYLDKFRHLRQTLAEKTLEVDKTFTLSSPYLIHNKRTKNIMASLLRKNVDINVYTNSLASTDAVYVAANLYLYIKAWAKAGINIHLHDGKFLHEGPAISEEAEKARWGTHDKTQVYEASTHTEVMIGTYNLDNRSNFYNTEMAMFCRGNDELSMEVKESIMRRAGKGIAILHDGTGIDAEGLKKDIHGTTRNKVMLMKLITLPSWLLNFLL